ncbi:hypothetical protein [Paraburkholderia phenazinium]|uniref:hypothetical protein n=1 Tax=Paraburkholderia phenazinium TaxID=60549 RepID=UPI000B87DBB0|nr:hypothetical protein [Paraburkholderia phenazinium]
MKTSFTRTPDKSATRPRLLSASGLAVAIACLVMAAPLQAQEEHHGGQQHAQGHGAPRQAYRHDDHRHYGHAYGNSGYGYQGYDAPPLVYAPQAAPGISLFLPL